MNNVLVFRQIDINSNFDYALNLPYYDGDIADMLNINMSMYQCIVSLIFNLIILLLIHYNKYIIKRFEVYPTIIDIN